MRWAFAGLMAVHGLIHFLGFARAFELAELPELGGPISRPVGAAWLGAGLAMLAAAVPLVVAPRVWWSGSARRSRFRGRRSRKSWR